MRKLVVALLVIAGLSLSVASMAKTTDKVKAKAHHAAHHHHVHHRHHAMHAKKHHVMKKAKHKAKSHA